MNDYAINAERVTVSYPSDEGERTIINDVTLRVRDGEFITVVGPSGCGKSTLLRLVLGSQQPTLGNVTVDNHRVERVTRDCGIVYQNYSLFPHLTVLQNIALGPLLEHTNVFQRLLGKTVAPALAALLGKYGDYKNANGVHNLFKYHRVQRGVLDKAKELLADCGLDVTKDVDKFPHELSGGMRQRVAIAQAIMMEPRILLMDEPFGALDHERRLRMQAFIYEQWKRHKLTLFFVTHDLEEALKLGTRLVCLSQYWTDESGATGKGAKILIDRCVSGPDVKPSEFGESPQFHELVKRIGNTALNRDNLMPFGQFDLSHPHAFTGANKPAVPGVPPLIVTGGHA